MSKHSPSLQPISNLLAIIRNTKPDIVQTWMYHANLAGGLAARIAGIRNVIWCVRHADLWSSETHLSTRSIARLCSPLSHFIPQSVIFCAQSASEAHYKLFYSQSRGFVIPNGFDSDLFCPSETNRQACRIELGLGTEDFTIGSVGRYAPIKGYTCLLDALVSLRERKLPFTCLLAGRGLDEQNSALIREIESRGLKNSVQLLGPRRDIARLMNAMDIFVLPSLSEAFPNVLGEAMSCGTPCVATNVGDAATILGGTGWLARPNDPISLSNAVIEGHSQWRQANWPERQRIVRKRIEDNFSLEREIASYEDIWRQCVMTQWNSAQVL
jgi:glycosyltransferase involved in cell wall biosynthesis